MKKSATIENYNSIRLVKRGGLGGNVSSTGLGIGSKRKATDEPLEQRDKTYSVEYDSPFDALLASSTSASRQQQSNNGAVLL